MINQNEADLNTYYLSRESHNQLFDKFSGNSAAPTISHIHRQNNNRAIKRVQILTTKEYITRLSTLQAFSTCLMFLLVVLQVISVATNDWFVLNLNEYIPTSKGGLFNYCYITSKGNTGFYGQYIGEFSCLRYENLPNYAVFVNSLLYDSRVLLLCACGFSGLILFLELFGLFCLSCVETRKDKFDFYLASRTNNNKSPEKKFQSTSSPNKQNKTDLISDEAGLTNSARFTNSIVINSGSPDSQAKMLNQLKPIGYFTFLTCAAIGMIGSLMEFALKISGFALFNSYLARLLELNTIFLAYRSYSYWLMVASIVMSVFYWLFKAYAMRYVSSLTKEFIAQRKRMASPNFYNTINTIKSEIPYEQYNKGKIKFF